MSTNINDDSMSLEIDGRVIATAQFSEHAAADGIRRMDRLVSPRPPIHSEPGDHSLGAHGTARHRVRR